MAVGYVGRPARPPLPGGGCVGLFRRWLSLWVNRGSARLYLAHAELVVAHIVRGWLPLVGRGLFCSVVNAGRGCRRQSCSAPIAALGCGRRRRRCVLRPLRLSGTNRPPVRSTLFWNRSRPFSAGIRILMQVQVSPPRLWGTLGGVASAQGPLGLQLDRHGATGWELRFCLQSPRR